MTTAVVMVHAVFDGRNVKVMFVDKFSDQTDVRNWWETGRRVRERNSAIGKGGVEEWTKMHEVQYVHVQYATNTTDQNKRTVRAVGQSCRIRVLC